MLHYQTKNINNLHTCYFMFITEIFASYFIKFTTLHDLSRVLLANLKSNIIYELSYFDNSSFYSLMRVFKSKENKIRRERVMRSVRPECRVHT